MRLPRVFCLLLLITASLTAAAQEERKADHDELRAMLKTATEALNSRNLDALAPLLHSKFSITTADQKLFTNLNDFKAYYDELFKTGLGNTPLTGIIFNPTADALTDFVGDNIGLSHGTSTDTYVFQDGDTRTMTSRWTATVFKDGGKWKLLNVHIGTSFMDNPYVSAVKSYVYKVGFGALLVGLVAGFVGALVWRRRRA
jgi:hypothetical protein